MASRELNLLVDVDTGRLVTSFNSTLQASLPRFVLGDSTPIKFRGLRANPSLVPYPWQEVDLTGLTPRIAIGSPGGAPRGGSFFVYYNSVASSEINFDATEAQVETALNANSAITADGGVSVTKVANGSYRITFNTVGAKFPITADVAGIFPLVNVTSLVAQNGSSTKRQVVVFRLEAQPAAYAELTDELPDADAELTVIRTGVDGVAEVVAADAVKAESIFDVSALVIGGSFAIGTVIFTCVETSASDTQITYSETASTFLANIQSIITANPDVLVDVVTAAALDAVRIRAKTAGAAGNSIATTSFTVLFPAETLTGGADAVEAVSPVAAISTLVTLEFVPAPYDGTYALAVDGIGTPAIAFDAPPSDIAAAIGAIEEIVAADVVVTGSFPLYTIDFGLANGDVGTVTCDVSGLIVPKGRTGILNTNTAGFIDLLAGAPQASAKLEIELYEIATATPWTIIQTEAVVIDDVIPNTPSAIANGPTYPTLDTVLSLYQGEALALESEPLNGVQQSISVGTTGTVVVIDCVVTLILSDPRGPDAYIPVSISAGDTASAVRSKLFAACGDSIELAAYAGVTGGFSTFNIVRNIADENTAEFSLLVDEGDLMGVDVVFADGDPGEAGTSALVLGRMAVVNEDDIYICTRLSPVKWRGPVLF